MSKFKALSTFQSWPKDWQKLCVEYWSECSGEGIVILMYPNLCFVL